MTPNRSPNAAARLKKFVDLLEIPKSYYEKAAERHQSLGRWFCRPESKIALFEPAVYPQGSFRLGTVVRPLLEGEEFDLDVVCELQRLTKLKLTQKELKHLVGDEVKAYAKASRINEPVVEQARCWRLDYSDEVNFHIDVLACLPEDANVIAALQALGVAPAHARLAVALTCKKDPHYEVITSKWPTSNPSGYGLWFEARMAVQLLEHRKMLVAEGVYKSVEAVPTYALKTPLQRSIQLLKRHRDVMFQSDPEKKPISMIITTLSALAYEGESQLNDALFGILDRMPAYIKHTKPRIANPVNPGEDFADKWSEDRELEDSFVMWHRQAVQDFRSLSSLDSSERLQKAVRDTLSLAVPDADTRILAPGLSAVHIATAPTVAVARNAPSPWKRDA